MNEWQHIESAPKDGTEILAWVPGWYRGKGGSIVLLWLDGKWTGIGLHRGVNATHWMPIPPGPKDSKDANNV